MTIRRTDSNTPGRDVETFRSAYELGFQLALGRRTRRTSKVRREVQLDEYGNPVRLIEESTFTEETEF